MKSFLCNFVCSKNSFNLINYITISLVPQGDQPICWQLASVDWVGGGGVHTRGWRGSGHRSYHPLINAAARRTLIIVPEFSSVFVDILIIITSHYVSAVVNSLMYTLCGLAVSTDTFITDLFVNAHGNN